MWRPKDWKNPYKPTLSNFGLGEQEVYGIEHTTFEAGADAMLEALSSFSIIEITGFNATVGDSIQIKLPLLFSGIIRGGKIIFIPEEDKNG